MRLPLVLLASTVFVVQISVVQSSLAQMHELPVGVMLCLTTACGEWGNNSLRGITLAVEEINAQGGVLDNRLVLEVEDTAESVSAFQALSAYRKLRANPDIHLFIGPTWTPASLALGPIIAKDLAVLAVSPSVGVAQYNESGENIFATYPHNDVGTRALASYAIAQGWKRAAVFASEQPYEKMQADYFVQAFSAAGGTITHRVDALVEAADLKAEVASVLGERPQAVFMSNTHRAGLTARTLRQMGYQGALFAAELDDTRIKDAQGALEGAFTALYEQASADFAAKYERRWQMKAGISSDTAYDTVYLYAQAVAQAGSLDIKQISAALLAADYQGASGRIRFDRQGGVIKKPFLVRVEQGALVKVAAAP